MRLELTQKLQQQQVLAPQMILSMDILLLTVQELEARIEKEFAENPALEISDGASSTAGDPPAVPEPADRNDKEPVFEKLGAFEARDIGSFSRTSGRRFRSDSEGDKQAMLQNTACKPPGLQDFLLTQLHIAGLERRIQTIAEEIIHNLDHRGYLCAPTHEIFDGLQHVCSKEEFDRALQAVRSLEPSGVAAEDLRECLLLQLEKDPQDYQLETQIIRHHLEDLGQNKIPKIAKELGATLEDIKDAVEIITSLDPLPGSRYESEPTVYVHPEIIVEKGEQGFEVRLADGSVPNLSVSEACRKLLKESRGNQQVSTFLRRKIESAQWLIHAIRQRQRTLHDIAVSIVEYQQAFMSDGPRHLRAMRMQTIADRVGVHISTISRAIKGKYMQTPWGVFDLRYFFTGGVSTAEGEIESRRNVCRLILEIIEKEDKRHPHSDSRIAEVLQERGLAIARRTVTKYREQQRIPSSRMRRSY